MLLRPGSRFPVELHPVTSLFACCRKRREYVFGTEYISGLPFNTPPTELQEIAFKTLYENLRHLLCFGGGGRGVRWVVLTPNPAPSRSGHRVGCRPRPTAAPQYLKVGSCQGLYEYVSKLSKEGDLDFFPTRHPSFSFKPGRVPGPSSTRSPA